MLKSRRAEVIAVFVLSIMMISVLSLVTERTYATESENDVQDVFASENYDSLSKQPGVQTDTAVTDADADGGLVMNAASNACTISFNPTTGVVNVSGYLPRGDVFLGLFVDNDMLKGPNDLGKATINEYINMSRYPVGYHNITVWTKSSYEKGVPYKVRKYVPSEVRVRPINNIRSYQTYSTRIEYNTTSNYQAGYTLYMDYRIKGGQWRRSGALSYPYNTYKLPAKGGCIYQSRLFYGKSVKYAQDGKTYFFTGLRSGKGSNIVTFRTGKAIGPQIRSINVQSIGVKKRTGIRYGYYTGLPLGKYTYYTYRIRVTVNLTKAPATPGININGKRFRGNSRKYSFTIGPYSNFTKPRGKTFRVSMFSQYSGTYGGYSPMITRTVRVK